jgi:hypothetical protein
MPSFSVGQVSDEEVAQITEFLALQFAEQQQAAPADQQQQAPATQQQEAPATLPTSGGYTASSWPLVVLLLGSGLLTLGLMIRRRA